MEKSAIVAECALFLGVTARHRQRLASMARKVRLGAGQLVFRQDDPCPGIYCVGRGNVRVYRAGAGGKEHTLHMAGPGQTFAEVAVIGGFPCPAFAEATVETECALLPADQLVAMLHDEHTF